MKFFSFFIACTFLLCPFSGNAQDLHTAIMIGNEDAVVTLIDEGAPVEPQCGMPTVCSPLLAAIEKSQAKVIKHLIEKAVNLNVEAGMGFMALDMALNRYYDTTDDTIKEAARKVARRIIKGGVQLNYINEFGRIPLIAAAEKGDTDTVRLMLKNGAAINKTAGGMGMFGATALMMAAKNGHMDTVAFMLQNGADATLIDELGRDAASYARQSGHTEIISLLN